MGLLVEIVQPNPSFACKESFKLKNLQTSEEYSSSGTAFSAFAPRTRNGSARYSSFCAADRPFQVPLAALLSVSLMPASDPEFEADCIRRILAGEKQLFHELIRPCERPIYFLLFSLLHNEVEAEDAAQETAIKVYRNLHLFRGDAQFRT